MNVYAPAYQEFIARLRRAREEKGLTQVQAAKLLNKPHSYISKCELGERRVDFVEALKFAQIYGKSVLFFSKNLHV